MSGTQELNSIGVNMNRDFDNLTLPELKEELRRRNAKVSVKKKDVVER